MQGGGHCLKLDVRYKFLLLLAVSVVAFSTKDIVYGSLVFAIVCLFSFLMGQRLKTRRFIAVYAGLIVFILLANHVPAFLRSMLLMVILCARMCMPVMLFGQTFLKTTKVSDMVTGLYALHIPRAFTITFAVAMRFFPTAEEEIAYVRDAMALRGIELSPHNLLRRPSLVLEGLMVPLLVRASTIAEELSAASLTRGLDSPTPRTAFTKLHITGKDTLITLAFLAALAGVLLLRTTAGRW